MKRKKIINFVIVQLIIILGLFLCEKYLISNLFSIDRFIILYMVLSFLSVHLFIKPKMIWEYIYKKRYLIALILLVFCVSNKYHMSSVGIWNNVIVSEEEKVNYSPFLGIPRTIRSDEWLVSTPAQISQSKTKNPYSIYNNIIMGKESLVSLYPNLPAKRITILGSLFNLGYMFLDVERGFSFFWMARIITVLLVSFEFCMIITKKNKLYSLLGMFLIGFSPTYHWWTGINCIIWGEMAICFLYKFINTNNKIYRVLWSLGIGIIGLNYLLELYPAWQVPFGYVFGIIAVWLIIKNKDKLKLKDFLYLIPIITTIAAFFIPIYMENVEIFNITSNTVYPGERFSVGGSGWQLLFNYFSTIFYPFKALSNPSENAQFLSLFPIPIIIGLGYTIKNLKTKKTNGLITALSILSILLFLWNIFEIPDFVAKISLLFVSTPKRTTTTVGYVMVLLIVLIMSEYQGKEIMKNKTLLNIISIILISFIVSFGICISISIIDANFMTSNMIIISSILFSIIIYLFILNNKKTNKYLAILLIIVSFIVGGTINPISKGLSVFYEKSFAKSVREIVNNNPDAKWIATDSIVFQNYLITNGASTINSTNYYPNLELWKKIDPLHKYNEIYNRYAHIAIVLGEEESKFELVQADYFTLKLNYSDICKLDINYILAPREYPINDIITNEIYSNLGLHIYETAC